MNDRADLRGHAVVVGGSMAGLLAARVLAAHVDHVTLVERDRLPVGPAVRKGVPQGRHVHAFLAGGQRVLAQLFPGIVDSLLAAGATLVTTGSELRWHHHGRWKINVPDAPRGVFASRPCLEAEVRRRVTALPNVHVLDGSDVTALIVADRGRRVAGVAVRREGGGVERVDADLVVDASGRGSRLPRWLAAHGCPPPEESAVAVDVGYASRLYRPGPATRGWKAMFVVPRPPDTRGGFIAPIEDGRWLVTLIGWLGDHPPTDVAGWTAFAGSLDTSELAQALRSAEALTDPVTHRLPSNLRRHYERAPLPERLLVLGDALCSFNPVYGQGMTIAALEAAALDTALAARPARPIPQVARDVQVRAAGIVDVAWQMATLEDLRYPAIAGRRGPAVRLLQWYTDLVHQAAGGDPVVASAFQRAMHMLAPPRTLLRPAVVARVLAARLRSSQARRASAPAADACRRAPVELAG